MGEATIALNRKARHEFTIEDTFEAGLVLTGTEIKSIRAGHVSLQEAYARIERGEAWLVGAHIAPFAGGNRLNHEAKRIAQAAPPPRRDRRAARKDEVEGPHDRAPPAVHRRPRATPSSRSGWGAASSSTTVAGTSPSATRGATWIGRWPTLPGAAGRPGTPTEAAGAPGFAPGTGSSGRTSDRAYNGSADPGRRELAVRRFDRWGCVVSTGPRSPETRAEDAALASLKGGKTK